MLFSFKHFPSLHIKPEAGKPNRERYQELEQLAEICSQVRAKGDNALAKSIPVSQSHLEIMAMVPKTVNIDISPLKVLDGLHRPRGHKDKQKESKKLE